jgi:hypothetical protein
MRSRRKKGRRGNHEKEWVAETVAAGEWWMESRRRRSRKKKWRSGNHEKEWEQKP